MATEEEQQRLADVIKALPMRQRRVFVMATVQRRPYQEIAAELHISVRQVEKRMARALVQCRRNLERQEVKQCDSQS